MSRLATFVGVTADAEEAAVRRFLRRPRHAFLSALGSLDDQRPPASARLLDVALAAAARARDVSLDAVAERVAGTPAAGWVVQWPGEHYRLLAALAETLAPTTAVEVGTFTGLGALALRAGLPPASTVVTYDIVPWTDFPDTALRREDFDGGIEQRLGDLSDPGYFQQERDVLAGAGLVFVDGPKDGRFEDAFAKLLIPALRGRGTILVFDDVRVPHMLSFWRDLPVPKLDLTSFGHWCGTGLAEVP